MKILYAYHLDPKKINSQSGRPFSILQQLIKNGHEVTIYHTGGLIFKLFQRISKLLQITRVISGNSLHSPLLGHYTAYSIKRQLRRNNYDMIFSPSTIPFRNLSPITGVLNVACVDTLVPGFYKYYPGNTKSININSDIFSESKCVSNCDYLILPTYWALEQLRSLSISKTPNTIIAPFGANITNEPNRDEVLKNISERTIENSIHIITICTDWKRKRGKLVALLVNALSEKFNNKEINCHIIGPVSTDVSTEFNTNIRLSFYGKLSKENINDSLKFNSIMFKSHFCCIPSGGEAFGMALCEALAFGLPIIGSSHGGIKEIVNANENGTYLDDENDIPNVVKFISSNIEHFDNYIKLSFRARNDYESRLNWNKFYEKTFSVIEKKSCQIK